MLARAAKAPAIPWIRTLLPGTFVFAVERGVDWVRWHDKALFACNAIVNRLLGRGRRTTCSLCRISRPRPLGTAQAPVAGAAGCISASSMQAPSPLANTRSGFTSMLSTVAALAAAKYDSATIA